MQDANVLYCEVKALVELDWKDQSVRQKAQNALRRIKWLKHVPTCANGEIDFCELEKCLARMMRHWSFYWYHFMTINNGDDTFAYAASLVDDVYASSCQVVGTLVAQTMYDLHCKAILLAHACIKSGLIVTRDEKRAWRASSAAASKEQKLKDKRRQLEIARRACDG